MYMDIAVLVKLSGSVLGLSMPAVTDDQFVSCLLRSSLSLFSKFTFTVWSSFLLWCGTHSTHWSMVTHRLRNERTGFVFWTHRFLRKMADIRPLSQVRNIFTFVLLLFDEFKCCFLPYGRRYTSPLSSTARLFDKNRK